MHRSINVHADVAPDHTVSIQLPVDVPVGPIDLVIQIPANGDPRIRTFGDLLQSSVCGAWADRDDLGDSVEFARELREKSWRRGS